MKSAQFLARFVSTALLLMVACSSETTPAPSDAPSTEPDTSVGEDTSSTTPEEPDAKTFDLVFRVTDMNQQWTVLGRDEVEVLIAVNDDTAGKRVAWTPKVLKSPQKILEHRWPGLLEKGKSYRLAVSGLATYSLFSIDAVAGEVVLEIDHAKARASADVNGEEAYALINTWLTLAPGTYAAPLGADGTQVKLIVGADGGLVTRRLDYGCAGAGACGGVAVTSSVLCELELVRNDTMSATLEDVDDDKSVHATVTPEGAGLRVKGEMKTYGCCTKPFDVLAKKLSADTQGCK